MVSGAASADDVFDMPCLWRDRAVDALGLTGEQVIAALSPGAAFPTALRTIASAVRAGAGRSGIADVVDLGAGAGGASEWLRQALGANVIAIEPAKVARGVARRRFPELAVRDGQADRTGLPDASADVVVLSGIVSLIDDLDGLMDEVTRLLRGPGFVAIADLFPSDALTFRSAPNTFRSLECLEGVLTRRGFEIATIGCGPAVPDDEWVAVGQRVDEWIDAHCSELAGFQQFRDDQAHLGRHVDAGDLIGGCLVARRS